MYICEQCWKLCKCKKETLMLISISNVSSLLTHNTEGMTKDGRLTHETLE